MKRILASILAVVLLGTMAISGFAAETVAADEPIVSGTAQEGTNDEGTTATITSDGTAVVTVSEEDLEDGKVEVPVTVWDGTKITFSAPEGTDTIGTVVLPLTEGSKDKGMVVTYTDDEGNEVILDNTFAPNGDMVVYDVPVGVELTIKNNAIDFADVKPDDWFVDAFKYASAHRYIVGDGEGNALPTGELTDAAVYNVISRILNHKGFEGETWAEDAKAAAVDAGLAIDPVDGAVTRGQLADVLSNAIGADAIEAGLLIGDQNGDLNLGEALNRAQIAEVSERLVAAIHA